MRRALRDGVLGRREPARGATLQLHAGWGGAVVNQVMPRVAPACAARAHASGRTGPSLLSRGAGAAAPAPPAPVVGRAGRHAAGVLLLLVLLLESPRRAAAGAARAAPGSQPAAVIPPAAQREREERRGGAGWVGGVDGFDVARRARPHRPLLGATRHASAHSQAGQHTQHDHGEPHGQRQRVATVGEVGRRGGAAGCGREG